MFALSLIYSSFRGSFNLIMHYLGWRKASAVQGCNFKFSKVRAKRHFSSSFLMTMTPSGLSGNMHNELGNGLKVVCHMKFFRLCEQNYPISAFYLCKSLDRNSSWQASSSLVISGPLYRILNMEQANTDRPRARSTRKGRPPDTSSDDSCNADRGRPHWSACTAEHFDLCAPRCTGPQPQGLTEQRRVLLLWDTGTAPNTMSRKMVAQSEGWTQFWREKSW